MEKSAPYFTVGLFMTLAVFALVGFSIWLSGPHDKRDLAFYTVEFHDSISGLEEGSTVQYQGLKVGRVTKLTLVKGSNNLIHVDIGVDKKTPVRAHTKVSLQAQGITGLVRLELSSADDDTEMPPKVEGIKYPVLQGRGSRLYAALEDIPRITAQVAEITRKLNAAMDDKAVAAIQQSMQNLQHMTQDLNGLLAPGNIGNATQLMNNLANASNRLPDMVDHLNRTADSMDAAAKNLDAIIARNKGNVDRFAQEGLAQFSSATREVRGTAASVRKLADKLSEDPSQVLYKPASHGVEIPK